MEEMALMEMLWRPWSRFKGAHLLMFLHNALITQASVFRHHRTLLPQLSLLLQGTKSGRMMELLVSERFVVYQAALHHGKPASVFYDCIPSIFH
jgi:hypothetical protein